MSIRTNSFIVLLRNIGRRLGLNKAIARALSRGIYEQSYDLKLSGAIKLGDCVWDVGANVGHYTRSFASLVGNEGLIIGFEPSPTNFKAILAACEGLANVQLLNLAIGNQDGKIGFAQGSDDIGATSRVVGASSSDVQVDIAKGDTLTAQKGLRRPNVIKIDVEGFELEVLEGMQNVLQNPELRAVGIEVHFGILQSRGMASAARRLEQILKNVGFRVIWADASHMLALRT